MMLDELLDDAFDRGREVGRREGSGFRGLPQIGHLTRGVVFAFERSWIASYLDYERRLTEELRRVQRERWHGIAEIRRAAEVTVAANAEVAEIEARLARQPRWRHPVARARRPWRVEAERADLAHRSARRRQELQVELQDDIMQELWRARDAVDAELATGRGRRLVAEAIRVPPSMPPGARLYSSVEAFAAEDPQRVARMSDGELVLGGADFALGLGLEDPLRRWDVTRWRVSHLDESTREVYAVERLGTGEAGGRVWVLGALPDYRTACHVLEDLVHAVGRERNALVIVAREVQHAERRLRA